MYNRTHNRLALAIALMAALALAACQAPTPRSDSDGDKKPPVQTSPEKPIVRGPVMDDPGTKPPAAVGHPPFALDKHPLLIRMASMFQVWKSVDSSAHMIDRTLSMSGKALVIRKRFRGLLQQIRRADFTLMA